MEELFKELSKFARENREALKPAKQWLNDFDGDIDDAWEAATNESPIDSQKVVLVVSSTLDKGKEYLLNTILSGTYETKIHPSLRIIQNALEKAKKAVNGMKMKWQVDAPDFMFLTEAIKKLAEDKVSVSTMSRSLTPDNSMRIRYMRQAQRCKVHIGDFMRYIKERDYFTDEAIEGYLEGIERRKEKIRREKNR
jgi:hypothetical protein